MDLPSNSAGPRLLLGATTTAATPAQSPPKASKVPTAGFLAVPESG
jgi:hypothetical protein